jgi:hypothetical protein
MEPKKMNGASTLTLAWTWSMLASLVSALSGGMGAQHDEFI